MSRQNVEQSRLAYEAFKTGLSTGDFEPFLAFCHADFRWQAAQDLEAYEGFEGMKQSMAGWNEAWDWWEIEAEEFIDAGDTVIIPQRIRGKARQSGLEVDGRYYNVCEIRSGKLWRMRQFAERADALEALGLGENALGSGVLARLRRRFR